jgi:hypothetical protein
MGEDGGRCIERFNEEWNRVVVMDWSHGFWDKMKIRHYSDLVEKLS